MILGLIIGLLAGMYAMSILYVGIVVIADKPWQIAGRKYSKAYIVTGVALNILCAPYVMFKYMNE